MQLYWNHTSAWASKPYSFKLFKGCLPQILLSPFLNTLCPKWITRQAFSQVTFMHFFIRSLEHYDRILLNNSCFSNFFCDIHVLDLDKMKVTAIFLVFLTFIMSSYTYNEEKSTHRNEFFTILNDINKKLGLNRVGKDTNKYFQQSIREGMIFVEEAASQK